MSETIAAWIISVLVEDGLIQKLAHTFISEFGGSGLIFLDSHVVVILNLGAKRGSVAAKIRDMRKKGRRSVRTVVIVL